MAILDRENLFNPPRVGATGGQDIAGAAGVNVNFVDQIDLVPGRNPIFNVVPRREIGEGAQLHWFLQVNVALAGASGGITFELVTASNIALSADVEVLNSITLTVAQANAAGRIVQTVNSPTVVRTGQRYLGVRSRAAGSAVTGNVTSGIAYNASEAALVVYPAVQPPA